MKLIYNGKTKDVYQKKDGNIVLKFKDDLTGEDGVFDPGANTVGLTVEGAGKSGLRTRIRIFGYPNFWVLAYFKYTLGSSSQNRI